MSKWLLLTVVSVATLAADQVTKHLVTVHLPPHARDPVLPGVLNLVHVHNEGGAFGLFASLDDRIRMPVFLLLSLVAILVVLSMVRSAPPGRHALAGALSLVLGGALGNLVDRIRWGWVVDFIDVHWRHYHWPAFNVADAAIVVGVALLLFDVVRYPDPPRTAPPEREAPAPP